MRAEEFASFSTAVPGPTGKRGSTRGTRCPLCLGDFPGCRILRAKTRQVPGQPGLAGHPSFQRDKSLATRLCHAQCLAHQSPGRSSEQGCQAQPLKIQQTRCYLGLQQPAGSPAGRPVPAEGRLLALAGTRPAPGGWFAERLPHGKAGTQEARGQALTSPTLGSTKDPSSPAGLPTYQTGTPDAQSSTQRPGL